MKIINQLISTHFFYIFGSKELDKLVRETCNLCVAMTKDKYFKIFAYMHPLTVPNLI